ncbi:MAG: WYL domain-containing protein [Senegalimassilia faecalis]
MFERRTLRLRNKGQTYTQTPVQLMYSDGFYYLVCFSDKYNDFANYRIDRMRNIGASDERASRNAAIATFDIQTVTSSACSTCTLANRCG